MFSLNSVLTVRAYETGSHRNVGWETFTDAVIRKLSEEREHLVFMLWGNYAKAKKNLIDGKKTPDIGSRAPLAAFRRTWLLRLQALQQSQCLFKKQRDSRNRLVRAYMRPRPSAPHIYAPQQNDKTISHKVKMVVLSVAEVIHYPIVPVNFASSKNQKVMKRPFAISLLAGGMLYSPFAAAQIETGNAPKDRSLDEVVVTGTRNETDAAQLPATVSVIDRKQIEQANTPSLLPILTEQVPGLFVSSRGIMGYGVSGGAAGEINLRGISGSSGRLMVLIDGHPQYMGLMGHPIADAYQSLMAEKVEILRGPASVLYGSNAMGGVINIITRKMQTEGISTHAHVGYGSYNTLQTEATNRIRKGRFTSIVSGSYNRTDGHRADMGFEQYGGYAKLGYELSSKWKAEADVNITHFNASQPGEVSQPLLDADQNITRGMTSFALENHYEKTSGRLSFFYNWGRHKINDGYAPSEGESPLPYRFHSRDNMMGVSWYQNAQLFRGNLLTAGIDWYHFGGEAWNKFVEGPQKGERKDIVDKQQDEIAGYIDFRQRIGSWMTWNAGLRIDHHSQAGTEWIPQTGLAFQVPKNAEINLQPTKVSVIRSSAEMFMWGTANPDLKAESMWNYELHST